MGQSKIAGIDLGTTNSCVAIMEGGRPVVIQNAEGFRTTPSVVAFTKTGERLVGQVAKRQAITNPERTVQSVKREMGTNYRVKIDHSEFTPEQISSMILQKLKADAEAYLGEELVKAVVTVPAYFNDAQRQATKDAGKIAGLEVMRVINEPTASALAYGLNKMQERSVILVYDLGGGTFDVSILEINDGVFEVLATCGNNRLGGDDFDQCLIDWMKAEFLQMHNIDLSSDRMAMQRLKEAAEKAKIELSNTIETDINLPFLAGDATGPKHLQTTLSRTQFNALTAHLIESTFGPVQTALEDSGLTPENLEHIVLVGGSTRIPAVQEGIRRFFGKEPAKSVNPDEAVALGAAIQGSIIGGDGPDVLLLDVMSLSLGIETAGGIFTKIIERNTTVPTSRSMMFTTSEDGQSSVEVHVLQGERELAKYNKSLARFHLTGIPRAPRGVPQIEVTFEIDADGIVQVVAKDAASGITQAITIERSANLDPDEVARLQKEAEEYASQDQELKERIRVRIQAESLVSEAGRTIEKYGQKVESALLDKIASYLSTVKDLLSKEEIKAEELKAAVDRLDSSLLELGRAIYSSSRKGARNDSNGGDNNDLEDQVGEKTTGATS